MKRHLLLLTLCCLISGLSARAAFTTTPLFNEEGGDVLGWSFTNGQEFPGATGAAARDDAQKHEGRAVLKLHGDFTKGGKYVSAGRKLPGLDVKSLSFWIKDGAANFVGLRIIDSTGQMHQIRLKIARTPDWQQIAFPLSEFFAKMGTLEALPDVVRYQYFGGANDGKWHGPAKAFFVIATEVEGSKTHTLWLGEPAVTGEQASAPAPAAAAEDTNEELTPVALDDYLEYGTDWSFSNGPEFKGGKGTLTVEKETPEPGKFAQRLAGDFTGGGKYVSMTKNLGVLDVQDIRSFKMRIKTGNARSIGIRLVDSSGQTHQKKDLPLQADGQWHDCEFKVSKLTGGEHWGGLNDGVWHGPGRSLTVSLTERADPEGKKPELLFADVRAEAVTVNSEAKTYTQEDFEKSAKLPDGWEIKGDGGVSVDEKFRGARSLRMSRTAEKFDVETVALSPVVKVSPGPAEVGFACKADLFAPDISFNVAATLVCMDKSGAVVSTVRIAEPTGKSAWTPLKKQVAIPPGTVSARIRLAFDKTHGTIWLDDVTFASVAAQAEKRSPVQRVLLKTDLPGNMLYPGDKAIFDVTVETRVPLADDQRTMRYSVSDYWGAEQAAPASLKLELKGREKGVFLYNASLDLSAAAFETGKYYELHTTMDTGGGAEPVREFSTFVFLPKAEAKNHPWQEIPFSTRNWDNRIQDYFVLSDRIGLPLMGVWGSWKAEPPYKPSAPGYDFCVKNNLGVLTRTPIVDIEHHRPGYEKYTDEVLRAGIKAYFEKFGKDGLLMFVLGNEPQASGETVPINVAAYKLMYEEIKKISPNTFVVGTSIGASEEYFKLGFHHYCDAVDFHTYEDAAGLPKTFARYKELFAKYGDEKPIWSTESGLNSQGLPRRTVAADLIKKVSIFFAEGGQNISWFGICYPDRLGKARGAADDSFNVFNGLYALYCPRLDAVAYYNMVNGVCIKKFAAKKQYDGIQVYLFRDKEGKVLQVLWNDHGVRDVFVPLPGAQEVQMTRIDGSIAKLNAAGKGLTLRVGEDPILLQYGGEQRTLPDKLGEASVSIEALPARITRGESVKFALRVKPEMKNGVSIALPPGWKASAQGTGGGGVMEYTLSSPDNTEARFVPIYVSLKSATAGDGDLFAAVPVQGQLSAEIAPVPPDDAGHPALEVTLRNNNATPESVQWKVALAKEIPVQAGRYGIDVSKTPEAYFGESTQGQADLPPHGSKKVRLPLLNIDPLSAYKVTALLTDKLGRSTGFERFAGGFVGVPKVKTPLTMDGALDDAEWGRCRPQKLSEERQFRKLLPSADWNGPEDLSGEFRFLWDDKYLYIGVKVVDDIFHNDSSDSKLWAGDSVQILIDPARGSQEKSGKYDLGMALTPKGPQACMFMSADARVQAGMAPDIRVAAKKADDGTGSISYEIAIPWTRLIPFQPAVGANLGLAAALNEDDQPKRDGFMAWFGDIQSKEVSPVGDLILCE